MKKNNVDNLVQLSREGDSAAFEILFSTFKSRLHNSLFKILRNFHETEDIVQQSFIRAWEKIETFKGNSNYYTWLYRIGLNLAITKINPSSITLIFEDYANPVINLLVSYIKSIDCNLKLNNRNTLKEDISCILNAKSVIFGNGTFVPGILLGSKSIKTIYSFELKQKFKDTNFKLKNKF